MMKMNTVNESRNHVMTLCDNGDEGWEPDHNAKQQEIMDGMKYGYGFYNATNLNGALDACKPQGVFFSF